MRERQEKERWDRSLRSFITYHPIPSFIRRFLSFLVHVSVSPLFPLISHSILSSSRSLRYSPRSNRT